MMKCIYLLLLVVVAVACQTLPSEQRTTGEIRDSAMVVSAHPLASKVGAEVLRKGGNAIDAAIATQFALAVVYPSAGNIGGGGFMVLREKNGVVSTLDYREMAPAAASMNMFLDEHGAPIGRLSEKGSKSSGVPGSVAGMETAHMRFGKMQWKDLVQPAIDLALNGFTLTKKQANGLMKLQDTLKKYNTILPEFLLRDKWKEGDTIYWKDLGHTLERIRDSGAAGFYEGKTADDIVAEMKRSNGIITHEDLKNYKAVWRTPIIGSYKNYKVISMGPPSSGGIALIQLLKSVEEFPLADWGHNSVSSAHLITFQPCASV